MRAGLGKTLFVLGQIVGAVWWLMAIAVWANGAEGILKLAGFFVLPGVVAGLFVPVNAVHYYGTLVVAVALTFSGVALTPDDEEVFTR